MDVEKYTWKYLFSDFSLSNLLQEMGNVTLDTMKDTAKAVLLQQLGVDQWMSDTPCSITDNLYTPSVNGWNNGKKDLVLDEHSTNMQFLSAPIVVSLTSHLQMVRCTM